MRVKQGQVFSLNFIRVMLVTMPFNEIVNSNVFVTANNPGSVEILNVIFSSFFVFDLVIISFQRTG